MVCTPQPTRGDERRMFPRQSMKLTMFVLLVLLLLCYQVGNIHCSTSPMDSIDMLSLLSFKKAITEDPGEIMSYWNKSTHFCQWKGVSCKPKHPGRVTGLNLSGQELSGQIAASVGNLTFLRTLDLSNNHFSGKIPPLNNLHKLRVLNLSTNSLEGNIPDTLTNCSNLQLLDIGKNMLVGAVPPKIGLLFNLQTLGLFSNHLTGAIPSTLKNMSNLVVLILATNQLYGAIPPELGQLLKLQWLSLSANRLSGGIPQDFFKNLSSLGKLGLHSNMLGMALPANMGDTLPNLTKLFLNNNTFEGHIPASLGNASKLENLDLSANRFTGQIPSFGKLAQLSLLNLESNKLNNQGWEFMYALRNCSFLDVLSLSENELQGVIPNWVGNLPISLTRLLLGGNNLSGILPQSIANLSGLVELSVDMNNLTGTVGGWIGKLKYLQALNLQNNHFIGPIPSSIGNLAQLAMLYLQNNKFQGPIPHDLGNLSQLSNLDLSFNNLEGSIPQEIGMLGQLINLILSSNSVTGEIPENLSQCQHLTTIDMDRNHLIGNIPISIGNILGLVTLNLSHNNLSGTIPTTLSNLQLLMGLDLSYNHLHGEIPMNGIFSNATSVSLNNNWGLCGGTRDLHMPSCPTVSPRIKRRYHLIKILIPIFGFMSLLLLVYFLLLEKKAPRRNYLDLSSFGDNFIKISYKDLSHTTKDFSESNLIGRGSHGKVYRGRLKEAKMDVAVKVFDLEMRGADRSFMSECEALRSIQHRNLLPIITACSTVDNMGSVFKALVYEFMPNGNLDIWLHHKRDGKGKGLSLSQRISIAVNIADALDYLHYDCGRTTVHCDLKPSNILLDNDMTALLGDFGIARFYVDSSSTSTGSISSIGLKGTIGYIAPEYAQGAHASTSGDVYSFGIVLLEMMTGKRPTDPMFQDGLDIINFVNNNYQHQLFHIIDAHLTEECNGVAQAGAPAENAVYQCWVSLLELALSCTRSLPSERANMKQIASRMHAIKTSYQDGKK